MVDAVTLKLETGVPLPPPRTRRPGVRPDWIPAYVPAPRKVREPPTAASVKPVVGLVPEPACVPTAPSVAAQAPESAPKPAHQFPRAASGPRRVLVRMVSASAAPQAISAATPAPHTPARPPTR